MKTLINISSNNFLNKLKKIINFLNYNPSIDITIDDNIIDIYKNFNLFNSFKYNYNTLIQLLIKYISNHKITLYIFNTNINNLLNLFNLNIINDNLNIIYIMECNDLNNINTINNDIHNKDIIKLLYNVNYFITDFICDYKFINFFEFNLYKKIENISIYN